MSSLWSECTAWISYHLACISSMMRGAVFDQAVLIKVGAVAVWAGEGIAIRHRAEENKLCQADLPTNQEGWTGQIWVINAETVWVSWLWTQKCLRMMWPCHMAHIDIKRSRFGAQSNKPTCLVKMCSHSLDLWTSGLKTFFSAAGKSINSDELVHL